MSGKINITGLDRAEVLAALYNNANAQGLGLLQFQPVGMDRDEAAAIIKDRGDGRLYFDYLNGRVMKVDIGKDLLDPWLYDRDNGPGAAAEALAHLLTRGEP